MLAMDLGFFRRSFSDASEATPFRLDHGMLTASLQALQAASATAKMQARAPDVLPEVPVTRGAIVELLIGGPDWRTAIEKQGGSFNPDYANRASNT
jgi:hypothetical protein